MNIYDAIMKAADHIEAHPETFNFRSMMPDCGTPGCAIGWIGTFAGWRKGSRRGSGFYWNYDDKRSSGLPESGLFYSRMNNLASYNWKDDAALCAKGLRLYAEKYHGDDKTEKTVPFAAVLAMFDQTVTDPDKEAA